MADEVFASVVGRLGIHCVSDTTWQRWQKFFGGNKHAMQSVVVLPCLSSLRPRLFFHLWARLIPFDLSCASEAEKFLLAKLIPPFLEAGEAKEEQAREQIREFFNRQILALIASPVFTEADRWELFLMLQACPKMLADSRKKERAETNRGVILVRRREFAELRCANPFDWALIDDRIRAGAPEVLLWAEAELKKLPEIFLSHLRSDLSTETSFERTAPPPRRQRRLPRWERSPKKFPAI